MMTNSRTLLFALLALIFSVSSCSKDNGTRRDIKIDENNLTLCAPDADCQNLIHNNSDIAATFDLKAGKYRVFERNVKRSGISSLLYIKVPMNAASFSMDKNDILNGLLRYNTSCPACGMLPSKVVGGYAKGLNLTASKNAGQMKWIIEAQIIMEIQGQPVFNDTVYVKQYFYPNLSTD